MAYNKYKSKPKKKGPDAPVCAECLSSSDDREFYFVDSKAWNPYSMLPHYVLLCDKCMTKFKIDDISKHWNRRKKKKVIDTTGWLEGDKTAKGNIRYIFITPEGTEKILIAESGIKKGYKPKTK